LDAWKVLNIAVGRVRMEDAVTISRYHADIRQKGLRTPQIYPVINGDSAEIRTKYFEKNV
jgi:hypothetical protein